MTRTIEPTSKRRWPAAVAAGVMLTATLACATFAGSASAEERGRDHREYHHRDWGGGGRYYGAPPVVYGSPYYAAPPLIYGPGLNINIR